MMRWTVRLEARTDQGEVETTELVTFSRPATVNTLAEIGLTLAEAKALLAELQGSMLCGQVAGYAAHYRICPACGVLQPLKDRRTRRLQTLFGTVEVEAPAADPVRHGRGGGAAVPGLPLPPVGAHGGCGVLAGPRAVDRPLHAGAGAGAGRARGAHLVPGGRPDTRNPVARLAGEP